jgi:undecaprenyl-diphosphatase
MTWWQAVILGIIQGMTEFLPVSSSGHLVIMPYLFGWHINDPFVFDVLVQDATLIAVIIYFWKDLWSMALAFLKGLAQRKPFADPHSRLAWLLILASIPAGLFGLLVKDMIEAAFSNPLGVAGFMLVTAALLIVAERVGRREKRMDSISWIDALVIGGFQAISVFPGISRSGATITGGMLRHLDRPAAARFSFLMSVPVMLGAGLLATKDLLETPNWTARLPAYLPGFAVAAIVGYISIRWLIGYLTRHPLTVFAYYCIGMALLTFAVSFLR